MQIVNPATEEIIKELDEDTPQALSKKFQQLKSAQPKWSQYPLAHRVSIIRKFSGLLLDEIENLAQVLTREVGKPLQQSRNEVNGARNRIQWFTENAEKYLADEMMTQADGLQLLKFL